MTSKGDLRTEARALRPGLSAGLPDYGERVARFAEELPLKQRGSTVASYWPMADEADPRVLAAALRALGHPIVLPRVMGRSAPLSFRLWREGDPTGKSAFGVTEPLESAPAARPDVVLVPLLAFDAQGLRLGYGGGYYDRSLAALRAQGPVLAIGIAYAGQEIAALPNAAHDQRLDLVVTEKGVRRFG